jgi:predicted NUDIX family NTP pyrophosphohydrolase
MGKLSAGILLFRKFRNETQFLLVHPGGPFWAKKDEGAWSIPKGLCDAGEDLLAAAKRELEEETGIVAAGEPAPLGSFVLPSGKTVVAFALEQDFDPANLRSNNCLVEWPPKSGKQIEIPEVDRAAWFPIEEALRKITKGQAPIVTALAKRLGIELPDAAQRQG